MASTQRLKVIVKIEFDPNEVSINIDRKLRNILAAVFEEDIDNGTLDFNVSTVTE